MILFQCQYPYQKMSKLPSYPSLLEQGISGNPDRLSAKELHASAWEIVEPHFNMVQEQAIAHYNEVEGIASASIKIQEILPAAHHGQVDYLIAASDAKLWGRFDPDSDEVVVHENQQPNDEDLVDEAAIQTIINSGAVYVIEPEKVPHQAAAVALFRY